MARDSGYYKKWDTINIIGASIAAGLLGSAPVASHLDP